MTRSVEGGEKGMGPPPATGAAGSPRVPLGLTARMLRIGLWSLPLVVAVVARLGLPSFFEFESQEDTARTVAMLEHGELPLYGIGHVRFLAAALGPLVYYFKAIPYAFCRDPAGELVWLMLWQLAGILFSTLLVRDVLSDVARRTTPRDVADAGGLRTPGMASGAGASLRSEPLILPADVAAVAAGCLLALSMHSLGLTSHAHPSNFAATMVPIVAWAVHRWLSTSRPAALWLAGTCLGIMTQLYQLTLFLPALLVAWCAAWPRLPERRAVFNLLVPTAVCYVPYLLSELATGFFNTRNLFVFAPGPQDEGMVGTSSWAYNFLTLVSSVVQHRFLPESLDALWLGLAAIGLVRLATLARGSRSARFFLVFLPFYTLVPATVLGAPRYQLSQPAAQFLIALGGLSVGQGWGRGALRFVNPLAARFLATGIPVVALLVACTLLSGSAAGRRLREPAFYPMRVVAAEPAARTPSLDTSRDLIRLLRERYGVTLATLSSRVHSPFAASGHYGHHYLLRVLERSEPDIGATGSKAGVPGSPLLVVDELFPWTVAAVSTARLGAIEVHELRPGADLPDFRLRIECGEPWCLQRGQTWRGPPEVRFFWGCGEFRDLDPDVGIPVEQCEAMLEAPPHKRHYFGDLPPRGAAPDCTGCSDVLWLGVSEPCEVELLLDGKPLAASWQRVKERRFATALLPPIGPGQGRLVIRVMDCVPWYLDAVRFAGIRRPVPEVIRE